MSLQSVPRSNAFWEAKCVSAVASDPHDFNLKLPVCAVVAVLLSECSKSIIGGCPPPKNKKKIKKLLCLVIFSALHLESLEFMHDKRPK